MPAIQKMKPRHDAIAEWLLANPDRALGECAATFGVTQAWLSCIIHSNIFEAYYHKLLGDYHDTRIIPLRDKLNGIANRSAAKLAEKIEVIDDPELLLSITDKIAKRLEPKGLTRGISIKVYPSVGADVLAKARARIVQNGEFKLLSEEKGEVNVLPSS